MPEIDGEESGDDEMARNMTADEHMSDDDDNDDGNDDGSSSGSEESSSSGPFSSFFWNVFFGYIVYCCILKYCSFSVYLISRRGNVWIYVLSVMFTNALYVLTGVRSWIGKILKRFSEKPSPEMPGYLM